MSSEKPLIKLYRKRTFGDKLSDTFDFVGENFRTLLKYITYLVLPVAIVQTFCMNNFMTGYMESITAITSGGGRNYADMLQWLSSMGLYMLVQFVAIILVYAVSYTMMQLYEQRPERLKGVTFDDLRPGVVQKCVRQLVLLVTSIAIFVVIVLLMALLIAASPYFILPVIIIAVVVLPLFVLVYPINERAQNNSQLLDTPDSLFLWRNDSLMLVLNNIYVDSNGTVRAGSNNFLLFRKAE